MAKLEWDKTGEKIFEVGVDRGVLYRMDGTGAYNSGEAWNGLTGVTESPSGAESTKHYANNRVYANIQSAEEFSGTIEAFTYPDSFAECDGTAEPKVGLFVGQQPRKPFGLAYRTKLGNDVEGTSFGYKLILVYGALAAPSEKTRTTINESTEPAPLSWEFSTTPVEVEGMEPTATLTIDSTKVAPADLAALELLLYGDTATEPELPLPDDVIALFTTPVTP